MIEDYRPCKHCMSPSDADNRAFFLQQDHAKNPSVVKVETLALAWCGMGVGMNIEDGTCHLIERVSAFSLRMWWSDASLMFPDRHAFLLSGCFWCPATRW